MAVKPKDIDLSGFDSAVKTTPEKKSNGIDLSVFDNTVKKKDGGQPSADGSQTGQSTSISPSNSFLRSAQNAPALQSNFKDNATAEPEKDWSGIEASIKNVRDKYDKIQESKVSESHSAASPGGFVIQNKDLIGDLSKDATKEYDLAKKSNDDILKTNAKEIYKPVKDLIDSDGYKKFFDGSGNFKYGEASNYFDQVVKQNKGGQYLRDQLTTALKQAGQYKIDEPQREKFREEEYKKYGIDISKFSKEVFDKATAVQRGNLDLLEADTKIKGDEFLNSNIKPEATKVGTSYTEKVNALKEQLANGQIDPAVAEQQLQQANKDYQLQLTVLNKHYQEGVRGINIKAQDKFARINKEINTIASGITDDAVFNSIPEAEKKKIADANARVEAKLQQSKNDARKAQDEAVGNIPGMGGRYISLLTKSAVSGWNSGLANIGQYIGMKGYDNSFTDYLKSKQYEADVTQPAQYEYGNDPLKRAVSSTGQSLGASAPIMIPAIGVTVASGGLGLPEVATSVLTGLTSYYGEKAQNTGEVYRQMMEQTGDANKAHEAASRYEEKQFVMMPLYFLEGAGIQNLIKGKGVKQLAIGQAQELAQELPTEYWQNFTQAQETEGYKKGFGSYIKENPETAIDVVTSTLGQGAIMSAGGKIFQAFNKAIPQAESQYYVDMVGKQGVQFALENLQKQYATGVIDDKALEAGKAVIARAAQKVSQLSNLDIKGDDAKSFIVLSDTANQLADNAKKTNDEGLKIVYEQKLEETKQHMEAAAAGDSKYAIFKMPGGAEATKVVPLSQIESLRKSGDLDQLIHLSDGVEVKGDEALHKELQARKAELGNPDDAPEGMYSDVEQKDIEEAPTEAERPIIDRVKEYGGEGIQRTVAAHEAEGKHIEAMDFLKEQSLDAPNALKKQLGMRKNLTTDIIAENSPTEIDEALRKQEDLLYKELKNKSENKDPRVLKEIEQHISLLEAGLEKAHQKLSPAKTEEQNEENKISVPAEGQESSTETTNQNQPAAGETKTGITKEATELLSSIGEGSQPAFVTKNLEKIASDNGIEVTEKTTATDIIDSLKTKQEQSTKAAPVAEKQKVRVKAEDVEKAQPTKTKPEVRKMADELSGLLVRKANYDVSEAPSQQRVSMEKLGIKPDDSIHDVISKMIDHGGEYTDILKFIQGLPDIKDVKFSIADAYEKKIFPTRHGQYFFDSKSNQQTQRKTVQLVNATNAYYTFTHEILHWLTVDSDVAKYVPDERVKQLQAMYDYLKSKKDLRKFNDINYGLSDFKEFMVEALINPKFREFLSDVTAENEKEVREAINLSKHEGIKNIFTDLVDAIKKFINDLFQKSDYVKQIDNSKPVIDQAVQLATDLFLKAPSDVISKSRVTPEESFIGKQLGIQQVAALEDNDRKVIADFVKSKLATGQSEQDIKDALVANGLTVKEAESFFKPKIKVTVGNPNTTPTDVIDDYDLTSSGEVNDFMSGKTLENIFGESPEGKQEYAVQALSDMLQDGRNMIGIAQSLWGGDVASYGKPLFEYIQGMSNDSTLTNKKAVLLATFLGEIKEEAFRNPDIRGWLSPLENEVEAYYQRFMNQKGKELAAGRLLRLYRDKYLGDIFADRILEEDQIKQKNAIRDSLGRKVDEDVAEKPKRERGEPKSQKADKAAQAKKPSLSQQEAQIKADNKLKDLEDRLGKKPKETLVDKIMAAIKKINCK